MFKKALLSINLVTALLADDTDALLDGFDEVDITRKVEVSKDKSFEGKLTQALAFSIDNEEPYDNLSSLKSSLFLEYNYDLSDTFKFKTNANAFYDFLYAIKGRDDFSKEDIDALESEIELFDFYIQGTLEDNLDLKIGRQVVVWGKSDTIRITDILNPLDNRRPAMVDIEDLRLPTTMIKLDYYRKSWRITPIILLEQRLTKPPPFGGNFNPSKKQKQRTRDKPTLALDIAGEFSGFDINFYLEEKQKMSGIALNYVYESWLFKSEFAYKKDTLLDSLVGFEYRGIADTVLSYEIANRDKDDTYQHAFRASSDFLNATLRANYLISLFGKKFDKGGFQRAWFKYDISDDINANFGVVDYISGDKYFDVISDNDMVFMDISYSF